MCSIYGRCLAVKEDKVMLLQNKWISFVNLCIYLMCFVSGGHKLCSYIMVYSTEHCMVKSFTDTEGKSSAFFVFDIFMCKIFCNVLLFLYLSPQLFQWTPDNVFSQGHESPEHFK